MSWYLTIRGASDYSRYAETAPLIEFLANLTELRQTTPVTFVSAGGRPWVAVTLADCSPTGNYANDGVFLHTINVVELVCSDDGDSEWYQRLASRIAQFLDWSAYEDHDGRRVWPHAEL